LRRAITEFIYMLRRDDLGNFQITLAAQSMNSFRHRFMGHPIFIDNNEKALEIARDGYMGGRTEAFWIGKVKGAVHVVDINSQYPAVMATTPMPTKLRGVWNHVSLQELADTMVQNCVVAHVRLDTKSNHFPKRSGTRLVFPVGRFWTTLCTPELETAMQLNAISAVRHVAVYERAVIFRDFVEFFYAKRLEAKAAGDAAHSYMYKILMNSLYGKFGQAGRVFTDVGKAPNIRFGTWSEYDHETGETTRYRQVADLVQRMATEGESLNSSPAISAHVASAGRALLSRYIDQAKPENVFYCDTDSLMVNDAGLAFLVGVLDTDTLGMLKHERTVYDTEIRNLKHYYADGHWTIKGIRKKAVELEDNVFQQDTFRGFKGMFAAGDVERMLITNTVKHLRPEYHKGTVQTTGRVEPFLLHED
ncbi:hypothetical protein LCGC14_1752980, partial [marine sediment metagenome]